MRRLLSMAICSTLTALAFAAPAAHAEFSLLSPDLTFTTATGAAEMQAGSHPFATTVSFQLERLPGFLDFPDGHVKDVFAELPPGFIGNPTASARCSGPGFAKITKSTSQPACPDDSAIGLIAAEVSISPGNEPKIFTVPVYNLVPGPGSAVKLGFVVEDVPVTIEGGLSQKAPYSVRSGASNISQAVEFFASKLILWGDPASSAHDPYRGHCVRANEAHGGEPVSIGECPYTAEENSAFITLPTSCRGPQRTLFEADSWEQPGPPFLRYEVETNDASRPRTPTGFTGCEALGFAPKVSNEPTSKSAESPTGLNFSLNMEGNAGLLDPSEDAVADSTIEKAVVTLPEGVTTNPSIANGLAACTLVQYKAQKLGGSGGCPEASKVGTVEVESPVLEEEVGDIEGGAEPERVPHVLRGSIYVGRQHDNVFDNLLTIYMVIEDPQFGIFIKLPGRVEPDPRTGQLKTTFGEPGWELPQLPFSHFRLHFREGKRAPLITPATCGTFTTDAVLYPWADPTKPLHQTATFVVDSGTEGSSCAGGPGQLPSRQSFSAGTLDPNAGAYSPFVLKLSRPDGSQQLQSISTTLPQGLLGRIAGIAYCPDAQIAQAQSRSGEGEGAVELESPSCPQYSEVGTVTASAGAGPEPLYVTGHAYLAGPYAGAPLSLEIITPAIAGPFDLGVVAVRTALQVDPLTARITAVSDPIPTILHGLPLDLRSITVDMSHPNFTLNPTSCEPKSIEGSATTTLGTVTPLSQYFQAADCRALRFKPTLKLSLKGPTRRIGHPALRAVVTYPKKGAYANVARAQVNLPHSEFLDQGNLNKTCTRPVLLEGKCPKTSIYGKAEVWTPLLEGPLQGPVYLVGGFGYKLPALVAELNGQIRVVLVGKVDSGSNKGIRTTFETVPDAPVSRFVLEMKGGKKYGLLENSENLCAKPQRLAARFVAQDGSIEQLHPKIANDC
jgi:hypothetical protein